MDQKYLIINIGSQSKKFSLFDDAGNELKAIHLEHEHYRDEATAFFNHDVVAAGIRIVAPGEYFQTDREITDEYLAKLEAAEHFAPLHVGPTLDEIKKIKARQPSLKLFAISDSALYQSLPQAARLYGINHDDTKRLGLYRFGYHGISIGSVIEKLQEHNSLPPRTIICHLGGGVSVVAVRDGKVIDSSMGFSPLEGPVMSSRVGNIDAGALQVLAADMGPANLARYLNEECGLKGLSGKTADLKTLLELESDGDRDAAQTIEVYVRSIKKSLGAALAVLGGADAIILTATIGERSAPIRERLMTGLNDLGIELDQNKNQAVSDPTEADPIWLETDSSHVKIAVIKTAEARRMFSILKQII